MTNTVTLKFRASLQNLEATENALWYASNTINYLKAEFELGEGWTEFDTIRAVWRNKAEVVSTILTPDGKCTIPAEVLDRVSPVLVNLVGSTIENDVITDQLTTFVVKALTVSSESFIWGSETPEITASQFEQFVKQAREQIIVAVEATTLETGYPAYATYDNGVLKLGLPKGNTGSTGATPQLSIGSVSTGAPGSSAQASIGGDAEYPTLSLVIPRGDPGELVIAENGLLIDDEGLFYVNLND